MRRSCQARRRDATDRYPARLHGMDPETANSDWLPRLAARVQSGEALVAGVLSGTSGDGIDVVLARFDGALARFDGVLARGDGSGAAAGLRAPRPVWFDTLPFEPELARRVRSALDGAPLSLREGTLLSRDLGRAFGRAVAHAAREARETAELVGSHGQTVWHHDGLEASGAATAQLGDGDFVAEEASCAVVSDFRQRDIACGGEGAPISALADDLVFAALPRPSAVLNLGGMSNLTLLEEHGVRSFDVGPACALLDGLARRLLDAPLDEDGAAAARGNASRELVDELLAHPFLLRAPPKSTGRDTFGEAWLETVLARARRLGVVRAEDQLASAAQFVALSVVRALRDFGGPRWNFLVACGGGARHRLVIDTLALRSPHPLVSGEDFDVDPDAREALVFATLAARCVLAHPVTSLAATGARPGRVLGKLSPPPFAAP
jgi:anhydro-N-acetylmuramic acid kinase